MRDPETLWPGNVTVRCPNCGTRVRDYENRHRWVEHREEEEQVMAIPTWFLLLCAALLLVFLFMAIMARAGW